MGIGGSGVEARCLWCGLELGYGYGYRWKLGVYGVV